MPRRNRVTPFGDLIESPARGAFMGNRGRLHDQHGRVHRWADGTRWIICRTETTGRTRQLMAPGQYTELFFLDEATALAAGHRPCKRCRSDAFDRFRAAWEVSQGLTRPVTAAVIDAGLDAERRIGDQRRAYYAPVADLPDGAFVDLDGEAHLVFGGDLLLWTPGAYTERRPAPSRPLPVITPRPTVAALANGYRPVVDGSAGALVARGDHPPVRLLVARRDSWPWTPSERLREVQPTDRIWSGTEWVGIQAGLVPLGMDDRWFAFVERSRLHLIRSATGTEVVRADFQVLASSPTMFSNGIGFSEELPRPAARIQRLWVDATEAGLRPRNEGAEVDSLIADVLTS